MGVVLPQFREWQGWINAVEALGLGSKKFCLFHKWMCKGKTTDVEAKQCTTWKQQFFSSIDDSDTPSNLLVRCRKIVACSLGAQIPNSLKEEGSLAIGNQGSMSLEFKDWAAKSRPITEVYRAMQARPQELVSQIGWQIIGYVPSVIKQSWQNKKNLLKKQAIEEKIRAFWKESDCSLAFRRGSSHPEESVAACKSNLGDRCTEITNCKVLHKKPDGTYRVEYSPEYYLFLASLEKVRSVYEAIQSSPHKDEVGKLMFSPNSKKINSTVVAFCQEQGLLQVPSNMAYRRTLTTLGQEIYMCVFQKKEGEVLADPVKVRVQNALEFLEGRVKQLSPSTLQQFAEAVVNGRDWQKQRETLKGLMQKDGAWMHSPELMRWCIYWDYKKKNTGG